MTKKRHFEFNKYMLETLLLKMTKKTSVKVLE